MRLAFVTPTPEVKVPLTVELFAGGFGERLEKAARASYDGVELMVGRPAELDAAAVRAQVAGAGLAIAAIASGPVYMVDRLTLLAADAEVERRAAQRLDSLSEFAAAVGAPLVTIGGFRGRMAWAGEGARGRLVEVLRKAAAHAASRGVRLALEPQNRYEADIVRNTAEGLALLDEVGHSHLGLLLDTFHMNIEEPSIAEGFRRARAAGRLWHVHLGDSNRLPPGQGHLDFAAVVATLGEAGYDGYLSAELPPGPDADATGEATIRHMRTLVPPEGQG